MRVDRADIPLAVADSAIEKVAVDVDGGFVVWSGGRLRTFDAGSGAFGVYARQFPSSPTGHDLLLVGARHRPNRECDVLYFGAQGFLTNDTLHRFELSTARDSVLEQPLTNVRLTPRAVDSRGNVYVITEDINQWLSNHVVITDSLWRRVAEIWPPSTSGTLVIRRDTLFGFWQRGRWAVRIVP